MAAGVNRESGLSGKPRANCQANTRVRPGSRSRLSHNCSCSAGRAQLQSPSLKAAPVGRRRPALTEASLQRALQGHWSEGGQPLAVLSLCRRRARGARPAGGGMFSAPFPLDVLGLTSPDTALVPRMSKAQGCEHLGGKEG